VYGIGALLSAVSPGIGLLLVGNSILEGVGTALLIPPVYILTTMLFTDITSRAKAFGVITGMGGIGAAAGPLIGGVITTAFSWRWAFVFQAVVVAIIVVLSRKIHDPVPADPTRPFDTIGAVLSAVGLVLIVMGVLAADNNLWLMLALLIVGAAVLGGFFLHVRALERAGKEPLMSTGLFRNRVSNLGLVTQNVQWLLLLGTAFVVSAYLQVVRGYNAIQTAVIFTAATGVSLTHQEADQVFSCPRKDSNLRTRFRNPIGCVASGLVLSRLACSASVLVSPSRVANHRVPSLDGQLDGQIAPHSSARRRGTGRCTISGFTVGSRPQRLSTTAGRRPARTSRVSSSIH
jgi:MFS family permease